MRDDFKYKILLNELNKKGIYDIDFFIVKDKKFDHQVSSFIKFKFKDFAFFFSCVHVNSRDKDYNCMVLEYILNGSDEFLSYMPFTDYYEGFIQQQLRAKTFFELGCQVDFLNSCVDTFSRKLIGKYPDSENFMRNIENININYLIENCDKNTKAKELF